MKRNGKRVLRATWRKRVRGGMRGALRQARRIFVFLAAAGATYLFLAAARASDLTVRDIQVRGTERLAQGELLEWVGLRRGANIFSINLAEIQRRLLTHPAIRSAAVRKEFPATIVVRVEERVPAAFLERGERITLIDKEAVPIKEPSKEEFKVPFPWIRDNSAKEDADSVREALTLAEIMRATGIGAQIDISDQEDLKASADGNRLRFGRGDLPLKWDRYLTVRARLSRDHPALVPLEVDLRIPDQVIVKPGGSVVSLKGGIVGEEG